MKQRITLYATESTLRSLEVEAESLEEAMKIGYRERLWELVDERYEFKIIKAVNHTTGKEVEL